MINRETPSKMVRQNDDRWTYNQIEIQIDRMIGLQKNRLKKRQPDRMKDRQPDRLKDGQLRDRKMDIQID